MSKARPALARVRTGRGAAGQIVRHLRQTLPAFVAPTDIPSWRRECAQLRRKALGEIYLRGWPRRLIDRKPPVMWGEVLRPDPSYIVRKLRYEIYPDYWIPALLYEPARMCAAVPVVLNPNGHHEGGKAATYKQERCIAMARHGMMALNYEFIGMSELGADRDHNNFGFLDATGMAGVGFFFLAMSKALDVLLAEPHADAERVAVTGLSGGGWQAIVLSALDPRIKLCVPVAGYTSVRVRTSRLCDIGDLEQLPADMATVFDYSHMTAMIAPRPLLQILNKYDDCCFRPDHTRAVVYDAVLPTYRAWNAADRIEFHCNTDPGTHNYDADNRARMYEFLAGHFRLDTVPSDCRRESEILTEQELNVGLPAEQTSIRNVARERARRLAAGLRRPRTPGQRNSLRRKIADVVRIPDYAPRAERAGSTRGTELYRLRTGPWTVPAAVTKRPGAKRIEIVICNNIESGSECAGTIEHDTVVNADILGSGTLACDHRYPMLLETAGHRILGIQAAQVLAIVRFARRFGVSAEVSLTAEGTSVCVASLVAAALRPELFDRLRVMTAMGSLCHIFDRSYTYDEHYSVLCPGLLQVVDIPQLVSLLENVEYVQPGRAVKAVSQRRNGRNARY